MLQRTQSVENLVMQEPSPYAAQLAQLTDQLLEGAHPGKLRDAAIALYALFSQITGVGDESLDPADRTNTVLAFGRAVSPLGAGKCILDFARTAQFLRGVCAALQAAQQRFPDTTIEVLYAGCGPFAALAIPLTTRFTADQVRFTLLDIHPRSLQSAERLVSTLGLDQYVRAYVEADATSYVHPTPVHMVITETMHKAFTREPQVAITRNLAPQLCAGGILIPEVVTVTVCLYDTSSELLGYSQERAASDATYAERCLHESGRTRIKLGELMALSANSSFADWSETGSPVVTIHIPDDADTKLRLLLATTIKIFGSATLAEYDSELTTPEFVPDFNGDRRAARVEFAYAFGEKPGFQYRWIAAGS
jgi:hypothetical protein